MSPSPWADYLDSFAAYLDQARAAIEEGTAAAPGEQAFRRPDGVVPAELAVRALELVAETERVILAGERRKVEILGARRKLEYRARTGIRRHFVDEAL